VEEEEEEGERERVMNLRGGGSFAVRESL